MMKIGNQFPPCARRNMVEKALDKARQIGLIKPLDQKIYALSYLNGEKEYLESAEFQAVLEKVKKMKYHFLTSAKIDNRCRNIFQ